MDPNNPNFLENLSDLLGVNLEDFEDFLEGHSVASEPLDESDDTGFDFANNAEWSPDTDEISVGEEDDSEDEE